MKLALEYGVLPRMSKVCAVVSALAAPVMAQGADTPVLLALGDSLTQGYGLAQDEGFVPALQNWLEQAGSPATIINAGVSGDTTAGGLGRVAWSLTPEVEGMIIALGANDFLRGIDPASSKANLAGIIEVAQAQDIEVLLIGFQSPGNFGPDYKATFDAMYEDLSETYGLLLAESFFEGVGEVTPDVLQGLMQRDGLHPNAAGVEIIVDGLGPHVQELIEVIQQDAES